MKIINSNFTEKELEEEIILCKGEKIPSDKLRDYFFHFVIQESKKKLKRIDFINRVIFEAKAINECCEFFHNFNPEYKSNPVLYIKLIIRGSFAGNIAKYMKNKMSCQSTTQ